MNQSTDAIVTVTPAAEQHILNIVERNNGLGLHIGITKGCVGYMYKPTVIQQEKEKESDIKITTPSGLLIFIHSADLPLLQGMVVDCVKKELGQYQLQFNNPKAVGSCGCGESFYVEH